MLDLSTTMMNGSDSEVQTCHHDIASVVADMMSVSNLFNNNHTSFKFEADTYQEILISICYRLLHAYPLGEDRPEISQEYVFPLGLLALMTTMLFQHGRSQTLSYDLLAALLRNLLLDKEIRPPIEEQIFLWLLFVGGISVFGAEDRDWLVHRIKISLRAMNVSSWKDALNEIKRFPWISVVHDGPGEQLWKAVVWE
jgi:hypothetical protein